MVYSSTDRLVRVDHLQRHLNALRLDEIPEGEQGLGEYVEDEARHLPTAQFAHLDKELFARLTTYSRRYGYSAIQWPELVHILFAHHHP
jgi:hypothetical protein